MLNSKFDLYKPEWLELVFDNRNKDYGAYDLRRHYASNMVNAMGITFFGVAVLFTASVILRSKAVPLVVQDPASPPVVVTIIPPPITPPKKVAAAEPVKQTVPVKTTAFVPFVVKPDPQAVKSAPVIIELTGTAVGQTTTPGKNGDPGIADPTPAVGTPGPESTTIHNTGELDVMPEPVGGDGAWAKFLNKNLRFPGPAREEGISGRVILSFIIEKDGHLSNIVVDKPAGHGFDEEAMRVLKLAKAWKPGMQNGQAVRVKYYIPINFQLATE